MSSKKRIPVCKDCMGDGERNEKYDAYFCKKCDRWLETGCDDKECEFCPGRPNKPSQIESL